MVVVRTQVANACKALGPPNTHVLRVRWQSDALFDPRAAQKETLDAEKKELKKLETTMKEMEEADLQVGGTRGRAGLERARQRAPRGRQGSCHVALAQSVP